MTTFKKIKLNTAFQIEQNGQVFIKVRGGCRPGCGGPLYTVAPDQVVLLYVS